MAPTTGTFPRDDSQMPDVGTSMKDSDRTLIIVASILGAANLVSWLAIWGVRRRIDRLALFRTNPQPNLEAAAPDMARSGRDIPNVSGPLRGADKGSETELADLGKARGTELPSLKLPRTVEDLKDLECLTTLRDETVSKGRSLMGRPGGALSR